MTSSAGRSTLIWGLATMSSSAVASAMPESRLPTSRKRPPPIHLLPERLKSITARFVRYGTSNAVLFLRKDRPAFSIPYATSLYSSLCRNEVTTPRRFEEITDPDLRELFATYELMLLGSFLVGYLGEAGEILGREIIRADHEALATGWLEIERRLEKAFARDRDLAAAPDRLRALVHTTRGKAAGAGRRCLRESRAERRPDRGASARSRARRMGGSDRPAGGRGVAQRERGLARAPGESVGRAGRADRLATP